MARPCPVSGRQRPGALGERATPCRMPSHWQEATALAETTSMAGRLDVDTRLSAEGRVVIPAAVRSALGVGPGCRVRFVVSDGEVRLLTAQSLLAAVWANNHDGAILPGLVLTESIAVTRRRGNRSTAGQIHEALSALGLRVEHPTDADLVRAAELSEVSTAHPGPASSPGPREAMLSLGDSLILAVTERLGCLVLTRDAYGKWMVGGRPGSHTPHGEEARRALRRSGHAHHLRAPSHRRHPAMDACRTGRAAGGDGGRPSGCCLLTRDRADHRGAPVGTPASHRRLTNRANSAGRSTCGK